MSIVAQACLDNLVRELWAFVEGEMSMLLGVKDEVKKLQRRLERLRGFLEYAEQKIHTDTYVATLVKELKDVIYDADDILDTCMMAGDKLLLGDDQPNPPLSVMVRSSFKNKLLSCFLCLKYRHEVGADIIKLNDRIDEIARDNQIIATFAHSATDHQSVRGSRSHHKVVLSIRQTSPIEDDVTSVVGSQIEVAAQNLISSIVKNHDDDEVKCRFFVITGMAGIGKTTLARRIFNDENITSIFSKPCHENTSSNYSKLRIWLHVSKDYSETELLKEIIRDLGGQDKGEKSRAELEDKLASLLPQCLFLVLDDMWSEDVWYNLLRGPMNHKATKCRILVTTRHENVAGGLRASCIHRVDRMDEDTCLLLLCKEVFQREEIGAFLSLLEIGYKIVQKCDGLPLAVKAIAGVLRSREKNVIEWDKVLKSEMWSMNRINDEVPGALYLSYEDLQPNLKRCFIYSSAMFAINPHMYMSDLVRYSIDEGFIITREDSLLEDVAEDCYWELVKRNLLQIWKHDYFIGQICTMHDLLISLGQFLMNDDAICIKGEQRAGTNSSLLKLRRLLISNTGEMLKVPDGLTEPRHLRSLFIFECSQTKSLQDDLFKNLCNLRILMLSDSMIEEVPDSIGDLIHLRHLDLDRTNVKEIPKCIGGLSNLQTLRAGGCKFLHRLPDTITRLHKLRLLHIDHTPLSHVPKGIGKLKNLNAIRGLIIGHDSDSSKKEGKGCDLDELQHLSNLRELRLLKLHRSNAENAASAFADKPFLRQLELLEAPSLSEEKISRTQKIYNDLTPPPSLQRLRIHNFPNPEFPGWMMSSSLGDSFPNLIALDLLYATSCIELPPCLSQLPWLERLYIRRADAITRIGPQFFTCRPGAIAFPNLEEMLFKEMLSLEEWSEVDLRGSGGSTPEANMQLLPGLRKLWLINCPKLKALPKCLSLATNLRELWVENTEVTKIDTFPCLETLRVHTCDRLNELSNLPSLRELIVVYCPSLELVDSLDAVQHLSTIISAQHLPHWLLQLVSRPVFEILEMHCNLELLKDCLRDSPSWHVIHRIPYVKIFTYDHSAYMYYIMNPSFYKTNAPSE